MYIKNTKKQLVFFLFTTFQLLHLSSERYKVAKKLLKNHAKNTL